MNYTKVLTVDAMANGSKRIVSVEDKKMLLARVEDQYYAIDNVCPHLGGSLGDGILNGYIITCPKHGSQFDVRDGQVVKRGKITFIKVKVENCRTYDVKIEGKDVFIGIE